MLTRIVVFALVVCLVYLNYTTPKVEDHKAFLLAQLQQDFAISEEMQERIWRDIDYSNFMVCSFMKTKEDSKIISYGYLKKIKLLGPEWMDKTKVALQRQAESY